MAESRKEEMIRSYVQAYNAFDVEGMMQDLSDDNRFENISDDAANITLNGLEEFRQQALRAAEMFSGREQTILSFMHGYDTSQIEISYRGTLAENLPNGLHKAMRSYCRAHPCFALQMIKL